MKKGLAVCLLSILLLLTGCRVEDAAPAPKNTTSSVEVTIPTSGENERQYLAELMQEYSNAAIERHDYESYDQLFKEDLEARDTKQFKKGTNLQLIGSHVDDVESKKWHGYFIPSE
ncbi:hypothetical protein [Candidatus Enterococcus ferrettii]|uniref:Lipoprotein n=1 Tax=Candidatus Enterococcus ferrettii TaxID=2815324 RepID=A0ABV0EY00_9ENTE|nr:hypothetical protein [Enterococcus sp. 665A]MBO1341692.1 hypothetical protein [Enterococcus sp. 665A]